MPTQDELRAIIAATPDKYRALILTALFCGLRGSELRGLCWSAIDLKGRRTSRPPARRPLQPAGAAQVRCRRAHRLR